MQKSNIIDNNSAVEESTAQYKTIDTTCKTPLKSKGIDVLTKVYIEKFPANLQAWQDYFESESALVEFIEKQIIAHKVFSAARQHASRVIDVAEKQNEGLPREVTYSIDKLERRQPAEKSLARQLAEKCKTIDADKLAQIKALLGM